MNVFRLKALALMVIGFLGLFSLNTKSAAAESVWKPVKVQPGDTLDKIAKRYGSTAELWKKANYLEDYYLTVSQTLNIVFPYLVTEGDQLDYLAKKYNTTKYAIKTLNHLKSDQLKAGMVLSIPVNSNRLLQESTPKETKAAKKSAITSSQSILQKKKETKLSHSSKPKQSMKTKQHSKQSVSVTSNQTKKPSMTGKKTMQMKATAYNVEGNEKWGRLTASGTTVRHGVVAVDPNVIPLGTKLYVSGYDSPLLPKGGFFAIAEDTGGAIKGNRIDIFIDAPTETVSKFGIQHVKVTILK